MLSSSVSSRAEIITCTASSWIERCRLASRSVILLAVDNPGGACTAACAAAACDCRATRASHCVAGMDTFGADASVANASQRALIWGPLLTSAMLWLTSFADDFARKSRIVPKSPRH